MAESLGLGIFMGALGMWAYHSWSEPVILKNAADQIDGSVALTKYMSGQVGVIHGFVDDITVCQTIKESLERDGGIYGCVFSDSISRTE